jgi:nucleoside-diphosphate-sugar epimerase
MGGRRIFITGACGYVGRSLIHHFASRGADVVALVRRSAAAGMVEKLLARPVIVDILNPRSRKPSPDAMR